jgi:hypothetical protein
MCQKLGGPNALDKTQNLLSYPQSQYDNIKNELVAKVSIDDDDSMLAILSTGELDRHNN